MSNKLYKFIQMANNVINYPEIILSILFKRNVEMLKLRNGWFIHSPHNIQLWNHYNDIWLCKTYTSGGYDIKPNDIVIDIGANIGIFSLFAARYAKTIYSFEPDKSIYSYLTNNIKINNALNIIPNNYAICSSMNRRILYMNSEATGNSLFSNNSSSNASTMEVDCRTLKYIMDKYNIINCDFLKLDCEGSEYEIIFNTPVYYLNRIKYISMECHDGVTCYTHKDMCKYLTNIGFKPIISKSSGNTSIVKAKK